MSSVPNAEIQANNIEKGNIPGPIRHRNVCPTAGYTYGTSEPLYHKIRREQIANQEPVTSKFKDTAEFKLAKWLQDNNISQNARTEFFSLEAQTKRMELSYTSNHTLNTKIKSLPKVPGWTEWSKVLTGDQRDASGKLRTETVTMLRRNPVDVIAEILNKPTLRDELVWGPEEVFLDKEKTCQVRDEMCSGTEWARVQVSVDDEP
ncbi:hypothetical protein FS749_014155 [Ceratobasidium sp. UAMH 11750]|nr:hypothetical protein FS749_014155 [Ceratobasidium sp. UAMH 11750]